MRYSFISFVHLLRLIPANGSARREDTLLVRGSTTTKMAADIFAREIKRSSWNTKMYNLEILLLHLFRARSLDLAHHFGNLFVQTVLCLLFQLLELTLVVFFLPFSSLLRRPFR